MIVTRFGMMMCMMDMGMSRPTLYKKMERYGLR